MVLDAQTPQSLSGRLVIPGASVATVVGHLSQSPPARGSPPRWMAGGWAPTAVHPQSSPATHTMPRGPLAGTRHLYGIANSSDPKEIFKNGSHNGPRAGMMFFMGL